MPGNSAPTHFIVIGGSAGSITACKEIFAQLPSDFPASIFVVVHVSGSRISLLPEIFSRAGPLEATHPTDQEPTRRGHIYVAPPDHHLTISDGRVRVRRGPRENLHRPAIDPLFRTAAHTFAQRLIGVVLSGYLSDGAAGLFAVGKNGGITIVQTPEDADAPDMPSNAIRYAKPAHVLPADQIGPMLVRLVAHAEDHVSSNTGKDENPEANLHAITPDDGEGKPSVYACPDCHGSLWELKEGELIRLRCRVGHSFTLDSLEAELSQSTERALWAAMRALEEKAAVARRLSSSEAIKPESGARFSEQADADERHAGEIRKIIFGE